MVCSMQLFLAQEPWFIAALLCAGIMALFCSMQLALTQEPCADPELPLVTEKPIALLKTSLAQTKGKVKGKGKPKANARAKGKPRAKAAAAKQKAMKKPAASWDSWAEHREADGDGEEEEEGECGKDYPALTKSPGIHV